MTRVLVIPQKPKKFVPISGQRSARTKLTRRTKRVLVFLEWMLKTPRPWTMEELRDEAEALQDFFRNAK